jgi:hypothetical protein
VAHEAAQARALLPDVDDQMVGGVADTGVDQLEDVDPEQVSAAARSRSSIAGSSTSTARPVSLASPGQAVGSSEGSTVAL